MLYTREEIDRIRTSVDLVTVVQSCGTITLESKGSSLTALCPFHEDHHPSFFIYPDSQRWICYGCNSRGDVIDFVRGYYHFGFHQALSFLHNRVEPTSKSITLRHVSHDFMQTDPSDLDCGLFKLYRLSQDLVTNRLIELDEHRNNGKISLCDFYTKQHMIDTDLLDIDEKLQEYSHKIRVNRVKRGKHEF